MSFVHRYFDSRVRIKLLRQFARDRHRGRDLHLSGSKLIQNIEEKIRTLDSRDSHDSPNIYRQLLTLLNLLRLQRLGFSIATEFDTGEGNSVSFEWIVNDSPFRNVIQSILRGVRRGDEYMWFNSRLNRRIRLTYDS